MPHMSKPGFVETEPKTARGLRQIDLPQFVVDALQKQRAYRLIYNKERVISGKIMIWCSQISTADMLSLIRICNLT